MIAVPSRLVGRGNRIRLIGAQPYLEYNTYFLESISMKREYRWTVAPTTNAEAITQLAKEINVPEAIAKVLVNRGISTYNQAKEFFRPELKGLNDPFLMEGMVKAV